MRDNVETFDEYIFPVFGPQKRETGNLEKIRGKTGNGVIPAR